MIAAVERRPESSADPVTDRLGERLLLAPEDVRVLLGIGRDTTYKLFDRPDFPGLRLGRKRYVSRPALLDWLAAQAPDGGR